MISNYKKQKQKLANGETLAYLDTETNKETILILHGNLASSVHMVKLMDQLKTSYRVIAPDLRGFGDSSLNNSFISLRDLAYDILLLCNTLNIKKAHVIGWSTGFGVAMELATLNPNLVQSLLSLQGMSVRGYYRHKKDDQGNIIPHKKYESFSAMKKEPEMMYVHQALLKQNYKMIKTLWTQTLLLYDVVSDEVLGQYIKETLKQRTQDIINWAWVNFNISNESNRYTPGNSLVNAIECPVFITKGWKDKLVTPEMVDENIQAFKDCTVYEFPDAGHCLHLEQQDALVKIILQSYKTL